MKNYIVTFQSILHLSNVKSQTIILNFKTQLVFISLKDKDTIHKWNGSGASAARSTTVQEDLGSIPTQDNIFWKIPFFWHWNEKAYSCNISVICNIWCLLSEIKLWI